MNGYRHLMEKSGRDKSCPGRVGQVPSRLLLTPIHSSIIVVVWGICMARDALKRSPHRATGCVRKLPDAE
jgi:hypothetical protein